MYELIVYSGDYKKQLNADYPDLILREGLYLINIKLVEDK